MGESEGNMKKSYKRKRKYTNKEKYDYFESRANPFDKSISMWKHVYAMEWVNGFDQKERKSKKIMLVNNEIQKRIKDHEPLTLFDIRLHGYRSGIMSSLKK